MMIENNTLKYATKAKQTKMNQKNSQKPSMSTLPVLGFTHQEFGRLTFRA